MIFAVESPKPATATQSTLYLFFLTLQHLPFIAINQFDSLLQKAKRIRSYVGWHSLKECRNQCVGKGEGCVMDSELS